MMYVEHTVGESGSDLAQACSRAWRKRGFAGGFHIAHCYIEQNRQESEVIQAKQSNDSDGTHRFWFFNGSGSNQLEE